MINRGFVIRKSVVGLLVVVGWLIGSQTASAQESGKEIFQQRCTACHTIGKGKLVGPDLSGVTSRREESWLQRKIKAPERMIAEKDPITMQLLRESNNVQMAPLGLSDKEVANVIAFFKTIDAKGGAGTAEVGLHPYFLPTLLLSITVLIVLTIIALKAGHKKTTV